MNIHKGDTVEIRVGKDSGKTGKVLRVDPKNMTVIVEGLNLFKRHSRPKKQGEKGQIVSLPGSLNISKIMLSCSSCKKSTRVGYRVGKDGAAKVRFCKKCNSAV
jgi:large subunit ribosomal protein L24